MSDRDEFEAWSGKIGADLDRERLSPGRYQNPVVQQMWQAWQAARRWRPIEEAPKENPRCLTYTPECNDPAEAIRVCPGGLIRTHSEATHWMPLSEPPECT